MAHCLVALGSNLGDRPANLETAVGQLRKTADVSVIATSGWFVSSAVGGPAEQGQYLNGAALLETTLAPRRLFDQLQQIERALGRERRERWASRIIDLDLLLYDDIVQNAPRLSIPHPWFSIRRFCLEPAVQVAATMRHPIIGWTVSQLYDHLRHATPYLALTCVDAAISHELAANVAGKVSARLLTDRNLPNQPGKGRVDVEPLRSGCVTADPVELLRDRAGMLRRDGWPQDDSWTISDFWLDDVLVQPHGKDSPRPEELAQVWHDSVVVATKPKIVIVLSTVPAHDERVPATSPVSGAEAELIFRATRPGTGPCLILDGGDRRRAEHDLLAAIAAIT